MAVSFKARVLLELGAELISSDSVALYELVKNALDAGSKKVELDVEMVLQPSACRSLVEQWGDSDSLWSRDSFLVDVRDSLEPSASDGQKEAFLSELGRPASARAALQALEGACFSCNVVRVIDWGAGMDEEDLRSGYLTVGTPSRFKAKQALIAANDSEKRLPLGEKGIGRLAAMRIGHYIHVLSVPESSKRGRNYELELDWRPVFADHDMDASALTFEPVECKEKLRDKAGTTITIRDIQADWTVDKLREMAVTDLGKLADPFKANFANSFLKIRCQGEYHKLIEGFNETSLKHADAECTISFRSGRTKSGISIDKSARLQVATIYRRWSKAETIPYVGAHLAERVSHPPGRRPRVKASDRLPRSDEVVAALATLGDFDAKFYWFNRGRLIKEQRELWDGGLKTFVRNWSGGLLVYRDGFRVYPYGSAADDWLDLDRKALANSAYKLNRAQIVGYLRIDSRTNRKLNDQTNREGFRDCPEKEALRRLLRQAIIADCKTFLERVDKQEKAADEETLEDIDERITDASQVAVNKLRSLRERVPEEAATVEAVLEELADVQEAWVRAKEALKAKDFEVDQYVHLAGVGLMVELIAHELARTTDAALALLHEKTIATEPAMLAALEAQLKTLNKRIRIIDELSIPGRQRKAVSDIIGLVKVMAEFYAAKLKRHGIECQLEVRPKKAFARKVEKGQVLQIIDNLMSNSAYWLARRLDRKVAPLISIRIDPEAGTVEFRDSGPGIPEGVGGKVFDAFYTTKPQEGRGLGLYIAKRLAGENAMEIELLPAVDQVHPGFVIRFPMA